MRGTAGSAAAPAARCRNCRRGSFVAFTLNRCRCSMAASTGRRCASGLCDTIDGVPGLFFRLLLTLTSPSFAPLSALDNTTTLAGTRGRGDVSCGDVSCWPVAVWRVGTVCPQGRAFAADGLRSLSHDTRPLRRWSPEGALSGHSHTQLPRRAPAPPTRISGLPASREGPSPGERGAEANARSPHRRRLRAGAPNEARPAQAIQRLPLARATVAERMPHARLRGRGAPQTAPRGNSHRWASYARRSDRVGAPRLRW